MTSRKMSNINDAKIPYIELLRAVAVTGDADFRKRTVILTELEEKRSSGKDREKVPFCLCLVYVNGCQEGDI